MQAVGEFILGTQLGGGGGGGGLKVFNLAVGEFNRLHPMHI